MNRFGRLLLGRLARFALTLLVASGLIFAASALAPGSSLAALSGGRSLPEASKRVLEKRFNLNDPYPVRYVKWLANAVHGDFGISIGQRTDVSTLISQRIGITAELVLLASIMIVAVGVTLGIAAGLRPGLADSSVLVATSLLAALPSFVAAVLLSLVFVARLDWLPALGEGHGFWGRIEHLTLPATALALASLAIVARVTRAAVRAELDREHVQTAVSRGIPRRQIVRRHVVRNAAVPIVTVSGLVIASLVALSAIVERAFSLNGLGSYLVRAAASKDIAVVQGISMVIVAVFAVVNLIVDLLYMMLDPRVRGGAT